MKLTNTFALNLLAGKLANRTFAGVQFGDSTAISQSMVSYEMGWDVPVTIKDTRATISGAMTYVYSAAGGPMHEFYLEWLAVRMRTELSSAYINFNRVKAYNYTKTILDLDNDIMYRHDDFVTGLTTFLNASSDYVTDKWPALIYDRNKRYENWAKIYGYH